MKRAKLWPLVVALGLLLAGTAATEVIARNSEGRVLIWEISGDDVLVGDEDHESDGEGDAAWFAGEAQSEAHAAARLLARRGAYDEALARFAEALEQSPDQAALWAEYGHWLRRADRPAEAEDVLGRALKLDPANAPAHLDRALLARGRGDKAGATAAFEEALRLRPLHTSTRIAYGNLLLDQKKYARAIEIIEPASTSGSNDHRARGLAALGRAYARDGQFDAARSAYSQAVERAPAVASLWAQAAIELGRLGDEGAAAEGLRYAQNALLLAPDSAYMHDVAGRSYEHNGLEMEAYDAYQRSAKLDPTMKRPRKRLIRLAIDREDWTSARRHAQSLLALDGERPEFHFLAGLVEFKSGHYPEARSHFGDAIAASPEPYAEAWYNLGLLERKAERPEEAIAAYEQAIQARPKYLAAINNLGVVYSDTGRFAEAEREYRRALEIRPTYSAAWTNLARAQAADGRYTEAITSYRRALEIDPESRGARLQLAVSLRKAGEVEEAIREYQTLLEQHPRYVKAWFNLGIALSAADRDDEAKVAYESALERDHDHLGARKNLGLMLLRTGEENAAFTHLSEALEARPGDAELRLALAEIARQRGQATTCQTHALAVLRQQPDDAAALSMSDRCTKPDNKD